MSFDKHARRQAQVLIDALGEAAQTEIKALRAAVEARAGALQKALSSADQAQLVDRVVQELANAAKEEAEARAGQVRGEVQKQAEAALTAARGEIDKTRHELEARLAEAQKVQAAQASALAAAQKDATTARTERDSQTTALEQLQERVKPMDQERKQLLAARDEANKLLEREVKGSQAVKAEVDELRQDLKQRDEKIKALDDARKQLEAGAKAKGSGDQDSEAAHVQLLERVGTALNAINTATTAVDVFEVLNEHLNKYFGKTVVFQVGASGGFKGWIGRGFDKSADISKLAIPSHIDALLKRALSDRKLIAVTRGTGEPPVGLSNSKVGGAVALPVVSGDKVIAVAYGETPEGTSGTVSTVGSKLGEVLIDHISRRLTTKGKTAGQGAS